MDRGTVLPAVAALAAALALGSLLAPRAPAETYLGRVGAALISLDADAAQALAEAQSGAYLGSTAATTTRTHALPAAPSAGVTFRARANGTYGLRLDPGASDAIVLPSEWGGAQGPDGEYLELRPGASALLVADAAGNWQVEALSAPFALQTPTPRETLGRLPPLPRQDSTLWAETGPPTNATTQTGAGVRWIVSGGTETAASDLVDYGVAGHYIQWTSATTGNAQAGSAFTGGASWDDWVDFCHPLVRVHVEFPAAVDANGKRLAVAIATGGAGNFNSATFSFASAGIALVYASDHSDTDLFWVAVEDGAGTNTQVSTHVTDHQAPYWVDFDWHAASSVRCTLYNEAGEILSRETLTTDVPSGTTVDMVPGASVRTIVGTTAQVTRLYGAWWCQRADGS